MLGWADHERPGRRWRGIAQAFTIAQVLTNVWALNGGSEDHPGETTDRDGHTHP
jgi:hypothetical protein